MQNLLRRRATIPRQIKSYLAASRPDDRYLTDNVLPENVLAVSSQFAIQSFDRPVTSAGARFECDTINDRKDECAALPPKADIAPWRF
jgi:hypothetical protein